MEDLEGWEILPEDGFLEIHDDGGKKIFSRKYSTPPKNIFKNYFSPKFDETTEKARVPNQLVPVPFQFESAGQNDQVLKEVTKVPIKIEIDLRPSSTISETIRSSRIAAGEADQDQVSQVFFMKMKETVVDMKLDSPKSKNNSSRGIKPVFQSEEKVETYKDGEAPETTKISSPRQKVDHEDMMIKKNNMMDPANDIENSGGLNILKWSLTGIGAICSFGVATVCIFVFGGLGKNNKQHQQNQKFQFHIYTKDNKV
ncbi:hypothetical protein ACH5RR_007545 [Cinchona calisaya]|uniref:DUF6821 domain-containing protein n=1 Tax=Cinchona calisaya TaxID=153742 RepID=A0ABD3AS97_9GENT